MSVWSAQRVANPTPSSLSYLLLYWSLPCLPPKLLIADSPRPPNPQDDPQALIDKHLQLLFHSLGELPSFRTIRARAPPSCLTQTLNLVLVVSAVDRHTGLSIANACLALPMRSWMPSSVPPFLLMMLPRYLNSSTSSIRSRTYWSLINHSNLVIPDY